MPYGTIELPRVMIDAASTFAKREKMSVPALFADLLRQRYGFTMTVTVIKDASRESHISVPKNRQAHRRPGGLRGRVHMAADFDSPSDELADLFENSSI